MNAFKLKGKIIEKDKTQKWLAEKMGISENTMSQKINGRTAFTVPEIYEIGKLLNLTNEEKIAIFLQEN